MPSLNMDMNEIVTQQTLKSLNPLDQIFRIVYIKFHFGDWDSF